MSVLAQGSRFAAGNRGASSGQPALITLIRGSERALAERELRQLRRRIATIAPEAEETTFNAGDYEKGDLAMLTAASLFADEKLLIVNQLETAGPQFVEDFEKYLTTPEPGVWMILLHQGGAQGPRLPKAINAAGYPTIACDPIKGDGEKMNLVAAEVNQENATITRDGAEALVAALGDDLGELLSSARQLAFDTGGHITREAVDVFHRGRVETKPYEVAQALAEKDGTRALLLVRQAFATGVAPVVIVSVLASKFRVLAKMKVPGLSEKDLKMPRWLADRTRKEAALWSEKELGEAILAIARADGAVKGLSRTPEGAVELCLIEITQSYRAS